MLIDCDTCRMRDIACDDCVINLLLGAPQDSLDLDADETAALGALAAGGLAPPLRLVPVRRSFPPDIRWQQTHADRDANPPGARSQTWNAAGLRAVSSCDSPSGDAAAPPAVSGL